MFKDIRGYEGLYQIDEYGNVKSVARNKGSVICKERMLKPQKTNNGYYRVTLCKDGHNKRFLLHRLVYEHWNGELIEGLTIHHIDENKDNNHKDNLLQCTQRENNHYSGEMKGYKLTEQDIAFIREHTELSTVALGKQFNVSQRHISRIRRNERWVI
ncbi:NUMOD4 domain-containing protein [Bacillus cereus group sp. BceL305]|uniref:NUMOD4 domain-containing protein n=1 Tax=Bacillus cereus group sp. BceL305 TaxID=3444980 RepID=UPI003F20043B